MPAMEINRTYVHAFFKRNEKKKQIENNNATSSQSTIPKQMDDVIRWGKPF